jgi:hypothetical protein
VTSHRCLAVGRRPWRIEADVGTCFHDTQTRAPQPEPHSPNPTPPRFLAGSVEVRPLDALAFIGAETSRRVSCDAGLVTIAHAADGQVLGGGPRKRTVPPSVRRALEARDRGCRFPGCGLRFTDAHHVKHWADGGESSLRNLVLLCRRHHRVVHEGGVRVCLDVDGRVVFFTPRGKPLLGAPPVGEGRVVGGQGAWEAGDTESFIRRPAYRSGAARWKRDDDIPWDLEARAWEALDSG